MVLHAYVAHDSPAIAIEPTTKPTYVNARYDIESQVGNE